MNSCASLGIPRNSNFSIILKLDIALLDVILILTALKAKGALKEKLPYS